MHTPFVQLLRILLELRPELLLLLVVQQEFVPRHLHAVLFDVRPHSSCSSLSLTSPLRSAVSVFRSVLSHTIFMLEPIALDAPVHVLALLISLLFILSVSLVCC